MKIPFTLDQNTLLHITTPSPWKPTIPFLSPTTTTTTMKTPYLPLKTWRIPSQPKGSMNVKPTSRKQKVTKIRKPEFEQRKEESEEVVNDDDHLPEVVKEVLIKRILVCVGVPLVTGLALLRVLSIVQEQNIWQFPRWVPYLTTFITLGSSTLGIVYGALSTSWEKDKQGSILGFEEVQKNWGDMWNDVEE